MTNSYQKTESERDVILSRLSDNLILIGMQEQLKTDNLVERNTDFLQIFDDRFNYITIKYENDRDLLEVVNNIKIELYIELCQEIEKKFDINTNFDLDLLPLNNFYFYVKKMYEFFVLDYRSNLITFFTKYIYDNKNSLVKVYKPTTDKTDIGVGGIRKLTSLDGTIIVFNLDSIISSIPSAISDNVFVIEEIINNDPEETTNLTIHELFVDSKEDSILGPGFIENFFEPLFNEEVKFSLNVEIEAKLLKLLA